MDFEAVLHSQFPTPLPPPTNIDEASRCTIHVDVLALFFCRIRYTYTTHSSTIAHTILESSILSFGITKDSILYVDGPSPIEKQATTAAREQRRTIALQHAETSIADLERRVQDQCKARKRQFRALDKHIRAAFYWPLDVREDFARYMRTRGWSVIVCSSEADIAIAEACQPNDVVVSSDSDMLAYDTIKTIWRPISRGRFLVYDVERVLQCLDLTRAHFTVLCIVSKNDYTSNLTSLGVHTNLKIVKDLEQDGNYLAHDKVSSKNPGGGHFDAALRIFVYRKPNHQSPPAAPLQEATKEPSSYADIAMRLKRLREQLDRSKGE
ncbi:Elongation of fatty acids protein 2, partial [Dissophora globulifera]